jgi:hypothetical protein
LQGNLTGSGIDHRLVRRRGLVKRSINSTYPLVKFMRRRQAAERCVAPAPPLANPFQADIQPISSTTRDTKFKLPLNAILQ